MATYEIDTLDTLLSFKNFTAVWLNCVKTLQNANTVKIKGRKIVKKNKEKKLKMMLVVPGLIVMTNSLATCIKLQLPSINKIYQNQIKLKEAIARETYPQPYV